MIIVELGKFGINFITMKVLMVVEGLKPGGTERRFLEFTKGLSKYPEIKYEIALMDKDIFYTDIFKRDAKIHFLIRRIKKDPKIFFQLYTICKKFEPDIIHSWSGMASVYSIPISKILKIKLINGMITTAYPKIKMFEKAWFYSKITYPFSDVILSNSKAGLVSSKAPKHKSHYIHNGFDFSRIKNLQDKEIIKDKFGIKTKKVVGMTASFSKRKDFETLLLAAEMILFNNDDVTFILIGDGYRLNRIKEKVKPEFREKIKFLGYQKKVESIVNVFDVGILSTHGEGLSNSITEYMALGKPVVATNSGGTRELLIDKKTGYLVSEKNPKSLAHKIEYLLNNPDIAKELGDAGRRRVEECFSLTKMVEEFMELYERILSNKKHKMKH